MPTEIRAGYIIVNVIIQRAELMKNRRLQEWARWIWTIVINKFNIKVSQRATAAKPSMTETALRITDYYWSTDDVTELIRRVVRAQHDVLMYSASVLLLLQ